MFRRIQLTAAAVALCLALPMRGAMTAGPSDEQERIDDSIAVLRDLTATPDKSIPKSLLEGANAIVVIPSLVKGGFIVGAKHGKGVMSVRDSEDGRWSAPGFVKMTGGSIGWQIGLQSVDLVLLVMNRDGVNDILDDKFTIGGAMSVAAGPVGRSAEGATDAKLGSGILAYSRAQGLFAGVTLEGASLRGDKDAIKAFYGRDFGLKQVLSSGADLRVPPAGKTWQTKLTDVAGK
jgi:lipid-binding SYLF domain-containing protein